MQPVNIIGKYLTDYYSKLTGNKPNFIGIGIGGYVNLNVTCNAEVTLWWDTRNDQWYIVLNSLMGIGFGSGTGLEIAVSHDAEYINQLLGGFVEVRGSLAGGSCGFAKGTSDDPATVQFFGVGLDKQPAIYGGYSYTWMLYKCTYGVFPSMELLKQLAEAKLEGQ